MACVFFIIRAIHTMCFADVTIPVVLLASIDFSCGDRVHPTALRCLEALGDLGTLVPAINVDQYGVVFNTIVV